MSTAMKSFISLPKISVITRSLSCTQQLCIKKWRIEQGLPANRTAEGILTDGPDYTFLDGRPTPLLQKQKKRMLLNQEYASQIVGLCSELDYAKQRHQDTIRAAQEEREAIINDRLRPKGKNLNRRK